jgi:carbon-monoxide dehydrogenase medium subunit
VRFATDGTVSDAAISLGSVAPTIVRVPTAEASLTGGELSPERIAAAARAATESQTPITDVRAPAEYRREMIAVLVTRALRKLADGSHEELPPRDPAMLWGDTPHSTLSAGYVHDDGQAIAVTLNGQAHQYESGQHKTLLDFLREDAGVTGTKEGCAEGECGACTIFMDGVAVMACMVPAPRAHGTALVTVEGLANQETLHPIQAAFVEHGAVQCGYCIPGFLMAGAKLIEERPDPSLEQIQQSISGNLCRCTGYYKIVEAFKDAALKTAQEHAS